MILVEHFGIHHLRHTRITTLAELAVHERAAQRLAGHADGSLWRDRLCPLAAPAIHQRTTRYGTRLETTVAVATLHAPALIDAEVSSVVRGLTITGKPDVRISVQRAGAMLTDYAGLRIVRYPMQPFNGVCSNCGTTSPPTTRCTSRSPRPSTSTC